MKPSVNLNWLFNTIHNHTTDILSRRGFRFRSPEAVVVFKTHGFKVEDDVVYFTGGQVESALEPVPSEVTILARDPRYNLNLTLDTVAFGLGRGAIYMLEKGEPARDRQEAGDASIHMTPGV